MLWGGNRKDFRLLLSPFPARTVTLIIAVVRVLCVCVCVGGGGGENEGVKHVMAFSFSC